MYLSYLPFRDTSQETKTNPSESHVQYLYLLLIYQESYQVMVQCAALNCTVKSGHGISMYLFPKDAKLRKIWTVRLKRDAFQPSQYTKLCERHFEKDQFVVNPDLAVSIGFQTKAKILIQGAVPSIFDHSNPETKHGSLGKRLAVAESHTTWQSFDSSRKKTTKGGMLHSLLRRLLYLVKEGLKGNHYMFKHG